MPRELELNQKDWGCPKKLKARKATIIDMYNKHFHDKVPEEEQIWSMCGQCSTPDHQLVIGCELDQYTKAELITPNQFHGAESQKEIATLNGLLDTKAHFYHNDFYRAMVEADNDDNFNPAIVNADMISMPDSAAEYLSKIIAFLTERANNVMLVCNLVLRCRCKHVDGSDIIKALNKLPRFTMNIKHWYMEPDYYQYYGTGNNNTILGSVILIKKG